MENMADALKMAAAVLVFVLALTISINAFGQARRTSQVILDNQDREYDTTYISGGDTQRMVSAETIVPSIYRAYKENYKIVFKFTNADLQRDGLYQKNGEPIYSIDLEKDVVGGDAEKERFIEALLYNPTGKTFNNITLNTKGLYAIIKEGNMQFKESLGIYYQDELQGESEVPDANRIKKRVITYEQQ